jgi:hypothetical protein
MSNYQRFSYQEKIDRFGVCDYVPLLKLVLESQNQKPIEVSGLLDTSASVNVLPYQMGLDLGANWEQQNLSVSLGGNLTSVEARGIVLFATIANFPPRRLVFAWAKSNNVPLLLGQMNFFKEFDVCFYGSKLAFDIALKSE